MHKRKRSPSSTGPLNIKSPATHELESPGERPRVEVRVLKINADGKLEELSCYPLTYYGSCPNVGDTIVDNMMSEPSFYAVQRRYFVQESAYFSGWALIVREVDPTGPPFDLWEEWQAATKFWEDVADQEAEKYRREREKRLAALLKEASKKSVPPKVTAKVRTKKSVRPRPTKT